MDFFRAILSWQEDVNKKKIYHLVNWCEVYRRKDMGGLGIQNLSLMNKALLCNWWWKLFNTKGMWQSVILNKYQKGACLPGFKPK